MGDWSRLPNDLLLKIGNSLDSSIDVLRFRSVCSNWRKSQRTQPDLFPTTTIPDDYFCIFKRPIYRISLPNSDGEGASHWIVKISKDPGRSRVDLVNPLSLHRFSPLPSSGLDLLKFRVCELGHEYLSYTIGFTFPNKYCLYGETLAVRHDRKMSNSNAAVLEYLKVGFRGLEMFKSGDKKWKLISKMKDAYVQVKLFKGKLYALDFTGRLVVVENGSKKLQHVADRVLGANIKCLVESCGNLLLVEACVYDDDGNNVGMDFPDEEDDEGCVDCWIVHDRFFRLLKEGTVRFKVYKLVESEKKWEEMVSLGDQILFLGANCTFSVSAADISGYEGNCIYTITHLIDRCKTGESQSTGVAVYHLSSGKIEFLTAESKHWKLFWPPPAWVSNTMCGREG